MKKNIPKRMKANFLKRSIRIVFLFISVAVLLNSCYKDRLGYDKIAGGTWNPDLAAPLIYADLDMTYMTRNSNDTWKEDPDGLMSLIYEEKGISDFAHDVISIPDQQMDTTVNLVLPPGMSVGDSTSKFFLVNSEFHGNNNERIDSILLKSGTMTLELTTDINQDGYIEVIIPTMTKYGVTFRERVEFTYNGTSPITKSVTIPVQDYYMVFTNNGNTNILQQYLKVSVTKTGNPDNSPYTFQLKQKIESIEYHVAFGYVGVHTFTVNETKIPISLFDNQQSGSIMMEDPHLYVTLRNSYGMPSNITFTDFYAERDGVKKNITSTLLPTLPVNYPTLSNVGGYDTTIYHFHRGNSNIVDVINMNPKKLVFKGDFETNPTAAVVPNFVLDTSHIAFDVLLELPFYGRALSVDLRDTSDVNIDASANIDYLESLTLNLNTSNGFPVDAYLQIYFADSNGVAYDSVFSTGRQMVRAGIVGPAPDYRVTSKTHYMAKIPLSQSQLDSYKKAEKMIISAQVSTIDQGKKVVKIYSDYSVYVELAARAKYKTDF
jgi:hypothetical protein